MLNSIWWLQISWMLPLLPPPSFECVPKKIQSTATVCLESGHIWLSLSQQPKLGVDIYESVRSQKWASGTRKFPPSISHAPRWELKEKRWLNGRLFESFKKENFSMNFEKKKKNGKSYFPPSGSAVALNLLWVPPSSSDDSNVSITKEEPDWPHRALQPFRNGKLNR